MLDVGSVARKLRVTLRRGSSMSEIAMPDIDGLEEIDANDP
jgi:hypothetical protein